MGYINTAVVRDKEGKILSYADYYSNQSQPDWITKLSEVPGNTISTTFRKDTKPPYIDYAGELAGRKAEVEASFNTLLSQRDNIVPQTNAKLKTLAHTTNNPFIAPGGREISRRRAATSLAELNNIESNLQSNSDLFNTLQGANVPSKKGTTVASRSAKAATDAAAYTNRNSDVQAYAQQQGIVITSPPPSGYMTKEQTLEYNKALINAQIPLLNPKKESVQPPPQQLEPIKKNRLVTLNSEPKPQPSFAGDVLFPDNTKPGSVPYRVPPSVIWDVSVLGKSETGFPVATNKNVTPATQYVITDKNGNVQRQKNLTQDEIRAYQNLGSNIQTETSITKYKVTDPSGRERTFNTKESADKFAKNYGTKVIETKGVPGSLDYLFGVKPKVQGANLGEKAFFVGANAEGYLIDTNRKIEPRPTATDFFGNNPIAMQFDKIFETNKPLAERSDTPRGGDSLIGFSNRELGELAAPFVNRALEAKDTITASATGGKFAWEPGFLGIPSYQPVKKSAKIETTLDRLAGGKPVDFTDKNERFSAYGSAFAFAGELFAFGKGVQGGNKAIEGIEKAAQVSKVAKATKLTNEGQVSGFTKIGDDTFVIARGTEGKSITVNPKIESTLLGISKTGKPITSKVPTPEPPTGKFSWNTFARTKNESDPFSPTTQPPPNVPVSVVEFGAGAKFKGGSITDFFKSPTLTKSKPGTPYIVEGEVNASLLKEFNLKEITGAGSKEFGRQTSGKTLYGGILNEGTISKVLEAERFGFIKPYAVGKTAPLKAVLKRRPDLLREYAGAKTVTTRTEKPIETIFSWKTLSRQSEIFGQAKPSKTKEITPRFTNFFETSNVGIRTPESFGIVNTGKIKPGETRGVTGIGSKGLDRVLNRVGLSTAKEAVKRKTNLRPFDFSDFAKPKGIGGSTGKAASLSLDEGLKAASTYVKSKPVAAQPQDILFSSPRGLLPQYQGYQEQSILAYPQGTPEKFKNQFKIETGLDTSSKVKLTSANSGDYFKRYGLETINIQDSKMDNIFKQIPISIQPTKQREKLKAVVTPIAITGLGQTPIQTTGLKQTPITTTGLETVPVTELIIEPIPRPTPTPTEIPPFRLGVFGTGFAGFGGGGDRNKRKKGKKKYIVSSIDPFTPGSIITAGVPQQQTSRSKSIYGRLDVQLSKARRKNQPKAKQFKDPFRL